MPRDPAEPDESPPPADELTALAQAHLDTIRAQSAQGGNKASNPLTKRLNNLTRRPVPRRCVFEHSKWGFR